MKTKKPIWKFDCRVWIHSKLEISSAIMDSVQWQLQSGFIPDYVQLVNFLFVCFQLLKSSINFAWLSVGLPLADRSESVRLECFFVLINFLFCLHRCHRMSSIFEPTNIDSKRRQRRRPKHPAKTFFFLIENLQLLRFFDVYFVSMLLFFFIDDSVSMFHTEETKIRMFPG